MHAFHLSPTMRERLRARARQANHTMSAFARSPATPAGILAAAVVGLAGLIHLLLTPEHFAEQVLYGVVFTILGIVELALATLLLTRPGPRAYRAGIWGSGLIALVYVATRLVPPPGLTAPEEVEVVGIAATTLELLAVVLLALALPENATARPRLAPAGWGLAGALLTPPLWLIATGELQWTPASLPAPSFTWYGQHSPITPALAGSPAPHIWLFAPWWTLLAAAAIAVLVGLNLWLATCLATRGGATCRQRRLSLLTLLPAALSGPLCCGTPLLALFGVPALVGLAVAPYATGLSLILLVAHLMYLRVRLRRPAAARTC